MNSSWSGIKKGTNAYPKKDEYDHLYFIGGGKDQFFKATAIEFYGIKG